MTDETKFLKEQGIITGDNSDFVINFKDDRGTISVNELLKKYSEQQSPWLSVDSPPKSDQAEAEHVIVVCDNEQRVVSMAAIWFAGYFYFAETYSEEGTSIENRIQDVILWQYIPEPPKS